MLNKTDNLFRLLGLIGILVLFYTICRLLFYAFNYSYFSDLSIYELIKILIYSIRFDLSVIVLSNSLFIFLFMWPFAIREKKGYRIFLKWLFMSVNGIAIFSNCVDLAYFQYTLKRTNASVLNFFKGEIGNDFFQLIPVFIKDYWYIVVIWVFLIVAVYYLYRKVITIKSSVWRFKFYIAQFFIFILTAGGAIFIYRGGIQLKPINAATAGEYTSVKYIPLVICTPFSILKTLDLKSIEPSKDWKFENEEALKKIYNPIHQPEKRDFKQLNVCVIILESFSKEYIGALNRQHKGYTPFLDSLINQSLTFTNAFANGKTSIDAIPSVVAGVPTWMNESFITSPYGTNQLNSLANTLKNERYYSAFFHGGTNGTMGFDAFCKLAGFDDYFGRKEYNNEKDFDGNWGIWDQEFLQYTARTIHTFKQPFFVSLFTLSSHHPYLIPDKYKNKFKGGKLQIEKCIAYSDFALKEFFETSKKMSWFNNTLFVLCADHTGVSDDVFFTNKIGNYSIPIIYYMPSDSLLKGRNSIVTQQIDILPSVLDYLNYPLPYFAFGKSVFDTTQNHFALTYNSGIYHFIDHNYVLQFNGNKSVDLYDYIADSMLVNDLLPAKKRVVTKMENTTKAIIQTYQQGMINNKIHY